MTFVLRAFDSGSTQVIHESGYHLCRVTGRSRNFTEVLSRQIALIESDIELTSHFPNRSLGDR